MPAGSWDLIREFLQGFLGSAVSNQAPQYLQVINTYYAIKYVIMYIASCVYEFWVITKEKHVYFGKKRRIIIY